MRNMRNMRNIGNGSLHIAVGYCIGSMLFRVQIGSGSAGSADPADPAAFADPAGSAAFAFLIKPAQSLILRYIFVKHTYRGL